MGQVFISHVEDDEDVALQIAPALEGHGFTTWCYERDARGIGPDYRDRLVGAIQACDLMVVLVSEACLGSKQVDSEITIGQEEGKRFAPVLLGVTRAQLNARRPAWRHAFGAATSSRIDRSQVGSAIAGMLDGLRELGIQPANPSSAEPVAPVAVSQTPVVGVVPLALPSACSWLVPPPPECPIEEALAYQQWARPRVPAGVVATSHEESGIEFVWVPPGRFVMGSDQGEADERPVHEVELDGFWIARTPVTVAQWRKVMGSVPGSTNDQGDDHPVVEVNWDDCSGFCGRLGLALPTEAQWEYAARGPGEHPPVYPWGNEWDPALCQSGEDQHGHERTAFVGSFPDGRSWCGALDMAGNVWGWCQDWYQDDFYKTLQDGVKNPLCSNARSDGRVLRGGSWDDDRGCCRSAYRLEDHPVTYNWARGFRPGLAR